MDSQCHLTYPQVATAVQWTKAEGSNGVPLWIIVLAILFGLLLLGLLIYVLYKVSHTLPQPGYPPTRPCLLHSRIQEATLRSVFQHRPHLCPGYLYPSCLLLLDPSFQSAAPNLERSLLSQNKFANIAKLQMANSDGICAFISSTALRQLTTNDHSLQVAATARKSDLFTPSDLTASIFKTLIKRLPHNKSLILDLPHPNAGIQKPLLQDGEARDGTVLIPWVPH